MTGIITPEFITAIKDLVIEWSLRGGEMYAHIINIVMRADLYYDGTSDDVVVNAGIDENHLKSAICPVVVASLTVCILATFSIFLLI